MYRGYYKHIIKLISNLSIKDILDRVVIYINTALYVNNYSRSISVQAISLTASSKSKVVRTIRGLDTTSRSSYY